MFSGSCDSCNAAVIHLVTYFLSDFSHRLWHHYQSLYGQNVISTVLLLVFSYQPDDLFFFILYWFIFSVSSLIDLLMCQSMKELHRTCRAMQQRVVELISRVSNEEVTEELLHVNDDLNNIFLRYERYFSERWHHIASKTHLKSILLS